MPKKKRKSRRINFAGVVSVLIIIGVGFVLLAYWAYQTEDSEWAKSIRDLLNRVKPEQVEVVEEESPPVVEQATKPDPIAQVPAGPPPIQSITMEGISKQKHLWPKNLPLLVAKQVKIRYNEKEYGFMEFTQGMVIKVDALTSNGEVLGWIDGNYLSLSVHETNFVSWFEETYEERYELEPVIFDDLKRFSRVRFRLGTAEGDAEFWSEMRIWCHQNYGSVSLEIGEENLLFKWLPKEDVPIDYEMEAREIARKYLTLRNKFGSPENFAACEIRHPVTDEFLGSSSMFIPRF